MGQDGLDLTIGSDAQSPPSIIITLPDGRAGIFVESSNSHTGDIVVTLHLVKIIQSNLNTGKEGILVQQRGSGSAVVTTGSYTELGADSTNLDGPGIYVWISPSTSAQLKIVNNGNIFTNHEGIRASHNIGMGNIDITHGGTIKAQKEGIWAYHGGGGKIIITNDGSIVSTNSGIYARHYGTGGGVEIVSSEDIETTGASKPGIYVETRHASATGTVKIEVKDGVIKSTSHGVEVRSKGLGPVILELQPEGSIGISNERVGGNGINAMIQNTANTEDLTIKSNGKIFSKGAGILASRNGAGDVDINHGGAIDSMGRGISAEHKGAGAIKIRITQEGSIEAQGYGIWAYHDGTGKIVITNDGSIVSTDSGIYARHNGRYGGVDGTEGGVEIVSSGDIETTGVSKPGIYVVTRDASATGTVTVKVADGEIKSTGDGVRVQSQGLGPVTVELLADGSIGISNKRVGGNGISAMIQNTANTEDLTIKSSGKIFSAGDGISASHTGEGAVDINHVGAIDSMGRGISAEHSGSGAIKIRITPKGSIEAQGYGIRVYRSGTGKIVITNDGGIVSTDSGIYARHDGTAGSVEIVSRGDIETTGTSKPGIQVDTTRSTASTDKVEVKVEDGEIKSTGDGVRVQSKGLGPVIVELLANGSIGISNERVGGNGINAMIQNKVNSEDLTIKSNGKIFSKGAGISASHSGVGAVDINHGGAIDSMGLGISAEHSGSGAIKIRITPKGSIEAQGYGIRVYRSGTGKIVITNDGGIVSTDSGIYARHDGTAGSVEIVSRGDIETTGTSKPGIQVDTTRSTASTDKVEVKVEDGEIKSTGDGVRVQSKGLGPVIVELLANGSIGISNERVGGNGINAMIQNKVNSEDLTIKSNGKIFSEGDGIVASHNGGGAVKINHGGAIDSMGRGISAQHSGSGAIEINQLGRIKSGTAGIYTRHLDTGIIKIINEGDIDSKSFGIQAYRGGAGKIDIEHSGNIVSKDFGIFARHDGVGAADGSGIKITSWGNIRTTGYRRAGIDAQGRRKDATSNIEVKHEEGEIESHVGISVRSARSSGSTYENGPPADGADPLPPQALKVIVSGGKIKARKMQYDPNLDEAKSKHQVGWKVRSLITTFDGPVGITVGTMDAQGIGEYIAAGDIPESYDPNDPLTSPTDAELDALITDAVRTQFRAVLKAALNFNESPGYELNLGNLFDPRNIAVVPVNPIIGDLSNNANLDAHLKANGGAVLLKFLKYTLSEKEAALVEALFNKKGLDAALSALPNSYAAEYRNQVKWFAKSYNSANIEINVKEGGLVVSEGDGIRAGYTLVHDKNGKIRIYVKQGAKVVGDRYGIWVNGAGIDDRGTPDQSDDIRDQKITVEGEVVSTGDDGAGIYLVGGGTLIIGPKGVIKSDSGISVLANDPGLLIIEIQLLDDESPTKAVERAIQGTIVNKDETELKFIASDNTEVPSVTGAGLKNAVIDGAFDVGLSKTENGIQVKSDYAPRTRVYEALPSVLLGLNDILDLQERVHAPRMPNGMWGRLGSKSGFRDLVNSTSRTSYKHRRHSLDTGWDIPLDDGGTFGISVHHRIGTADVSRGGSIDVSGSGLGVSRTWVANDFHVDVQAATTWYDADLASSVRGNLKSGLSGVGYAFGIEVGNRMEVNDLSVSPSVGLVHSSVKLNDFTDALGLKVTPHTARSLKARLGVGIAELKERNSSAGRLFGSLRLEREFSGETGITVAGKDLSSTNRSTALHLGAGIVFDSSDGSSLRAGVNYQTDGRSHEIGGALTLHF